MGRRCFSSVLFFAILVVLAVSALITAAFGLLTDLVMRPFFGFVFSSDTSAPATQLSLVLLFGALLVASYGWLLSLMNLNRTRYAGGTLAGALILDRQSPLRWLGADNPSCLARAV